MHEWELYWDWRADVAYFVGRHELELATVARRNERYPVDGEHQRKLGRALAALGRDEELLAMVDDALGQSPPGLDAEALLRIISAARVHGHLVLARAVAAERCGGRRLASTVLPTRRCSVLATRSFCWRRPRVGPTPRPPRVNSFGSSRRTANATRSRTWCCCRRRSSRAAEEILSGSRHARWLKRRRGHYLIRWTTIGDRRACSRSTRIGGIAPRFGTDGGHVARSASAWNPPLLLLLLVLGAACVRCRPDQSLTLRPPARITASLGVGDHMPCRPTSGLRQSF
jgi:hypothetical protein